MPTTRLQYVSKIDCSTSCSLHYRHIYLRSYVALLESSSIIEPLDFEFNEAIFSESKFNLQYVTLIRHVEPGTRPREGNLV